MAPLVKPLILIGLAIAISSAVLIFIGMDGTIIFQWLSSLIVNAVTSAFNILVNIVKDFVNMIIAAFTDVTWDWEWLQPVADWVESWWPW